MSPTIQSKGQSLLGSLKEQNVPLLSLSNTKNVPLPKWEEVQSSLSVPGDSFETQT